MPARKIESVADDAESEGFFLKGVFRGSVDRVAKNSGKPYRLLNFTTDDGENFHQFRILDFDESRVSRPCAYVRNEFTSVRVSVGDKGGIFLR
jgi:hypothetical protein